MKRIFPIVVLCLVPTCAFAGDAATKQAIAYVQKMQTSTGGFVNQMAPNIRVQPTLRATSSAIRALHYLGGELPNKAACIKFVESCHDADSGGFRDTPAGKPEVFTTAVGIMAVTELKMPTEKYAKGAVKYMSDNSKTFDEIRIAAAGLERLSVKAPRSEEWIKPVEVVIREAQTKGGAGKARDIGGAEVTRMRLGGKVADAAALVKELNAGQRKDGGFGTALDADKSDLESTYRVLRCYMMLKSKPGNLDALRGFVAKCRNEDGGYGMAPGQMSSVGGTYFAAIVLHWSKD